MKKPDVTLQQELLIQKITEIIERFTDYETQSIDYRAIGRAVKTLLDSM